MSKAIYPGSFDPPTLGHLDIIYRASRIFGSLVIGVVENPAKNALFSLEERVSLIKKEVKSLKNVSVCSFNGLLVDFVRKKGCNVVIRGLRFVSDFEAEFQMTLMNKKLYPQLETVFIFTDEKYSYISSSLVKEVASFGGNIDEFVSKNVKNALAKKRRLLIGERRDGSLGRYTE
ncbi:MAG: pantetheine-phosphate adenylyltransferase [Candidatus Hydrogenedentota bacterium]